MTIPNTTPDFELNHLCDYARGIAEPHAVEQMGKALAGSKNSNRSVELFRQVFSLGLVDQGVQVPDHAVRVAKAMASLSRPRASEQASPLASLLTFLPFKVTFDSLQALPAGTRDFSSSHQRITSFRAADFSVHVRVEHETNPHSQVVVGQLLRHTPEPCPVPEVPVLVISQGRIVGRSLTSQFGEFQADGLPPEPMRLCLLVHAEACINVPLDAHPKGT